MADVLIDTSAWIDFFRQETGRMGDTVVQLIQRDRAVITGPVLAELMQGVRSQKESNHLAEILGILPFVEVNRVDWENAGAMLRRLRKQGTTVPLTDALIAVVAKRNNLEVLTLDNHFTHLDVPLHMI